MTLAYCRPPAEPTPVYSVTDLFDRLSILRLNLWKYSVVSVTGGAAYVDPVSAFGDQKRGWSMPGGSSTPRLQVLDRQAGLATRDGAAYDLSFMAAVDSGTAILRGRWLDIASGAITGISDKSWAITTTPTIFTWEGIASDDPDFALASPNCSYFEFFVSNTTDIPSGRTVTVTDLQIQTDDYFDQQGIDLPWRPAPRDDRLLSYGEYILGLNVAEMAANPGHRVQVGREGSGLRIAPSGPVKIREIVGASYTLQADDDGAYFWTSSASPVQIVVPPTVTVLLKTKSRIQVRQGAAGRVTIVPGAAVTLNPPLGGSLTTAGQGAVIELMKRPLENWDVTTPANNLEAFPFEVGDETTAITTGTAKKTFRMPYGFNVLDVKGSLSTAQASGTIFTADINEGGTSILSTKLTIDNTEKTSRTAAAAPVISDPILADDAEMTIDIDQVGNGTAKGFKGWLIGYRTSSASIGPSLVISGTPVTTGAVGSAYAGFTVSATGGAAPYTFSVFAGALPAGLTLDPATGVCAGTPTTVETKTGIVIGVTDAASSTDDLAAFDITVTAVAPDPHFTNVVLLCGFEGADGSSTITDESPAAHGNATVTGQAQIDTAQFKFGSSSALFDGAGDAFTFPDHADFEFGSGLFTVEFWYKPASVTGRRRPLAKWGATGNLSWVIQANGTTLEFLNSTNGTAINTDISVAAAVTINVWQHIALDYDGTKYRLYSGGTMIGSSSTARNLFNGNHVVAIGASSALGDVVDGWIDEVRITKGVARYASDGGFTVPTAAFPRS